MASTNTLTASISALNVSARTLRPGLALSWAPEELSLPLKALQYYDLYKHSQDLFFKKALSLPLQSLSSFQAFSWPLNTLSQSLLENSHDLYRTATSSCPFKCFECIHTHHIHPQQNISAPRDETKITIF